MNCGEGWRVECGNTHRSGIIFTEEGGDLFSTEI